MKLYATIESQEGSRVVKKGSNEQLTITVSKGNQEIGLITFSPRLVSVEMYDVQSIGSVGREGNRFDFNL